MNTKGSSLTVFAEIYLKDRKLFMLNLEVAIFLIRMWQKRERCLTKAFPFKIDSEYIKLISTVGVRTYAKRSPSTKSKEIDDRFFLTTSTPRLLHISTTLLVSSSLALQPRRTLFSCKPFNSLVVFFE